MKPFQVTLISFLSSLGSTLCLESCYSPAKFTSETLIVCGVLTTTPCLSASISFFLGAYFINTFEPLYTDTSRIRTPRFHG